MNKRLSSQISAKIPYIIEGCIILLIVFTPVYYGSVELWAVTVIELTILFMLLLWGIEIVACQKFTFVRTPLDIPILLFCAYAVISTLFFSKYPYMSQIGVTQLLCISALYFVIVNHIRRPSQIVRLLMVILIVGSFHAFLHLMKNVTGLLGKETGVMLNIGNHFAGYMVLVIPISVALSFVIKDLGKRILLIFISVVMTAAMGFSLISGAILSFVFSLLLIALFYTFIENIRKQALIFGILVIGIFIVIVLLGPGFAPIVEELTSTFNDMETSSAGARLSMWKSTLAIWRDNPVFGTGLNTFDYVYQKYRTPEMYGGRAVYAHSDWLQLLSELGIIGLALSLIIVVRFFLMSRVIAKKDIHSFRAGTEPPPLRVVERRWITGLIIGGFSSCAAGYAHILVDFNFHIPAIAILFVIIFSLTVITSLSLKRETETEEAVEMLPASSFRLPVTARVVFLLCLLLVIGISTVFIVRPGIAYAHYIKGIRLERELFWDKAAEEYESAIHYSPQNGDFFYALANLYAKRASLTKKVGTQKDWSKRAIDLCRSAINQCSTNGNYYLLLGDLYQTSGNVQNAIDAYTKAISLDPNNAYYRRIYGTLLLKQGRIKKAVSEYKKSLSIYPRDLSQILNICYKIIHSSSVSPESQLFIQITQDICPNNPESHITLGQFLLSKGLENAALSEYKRAITLAPDRIDLHKRLSNLFVKEKKLDEAVKLWKKYLNYHPQKPQAHVELAKVYTKLNLLDDAIFEYKKAANLSNDKAYLITAGNLYMRQGKTKDAVNLWQTVIKRNPSSAAAHYRLGLYHEKEGNWITALKHFQIAIAEEPSNIHYQLHLAQSYLSRELFYEAIQVLEKTLNQRPNNISVHLQLAKVYQQIKRSDKARKHCLHILKIDSENHKAQEMLNQLSSIDD